MQKIVVVLEIETDEENNAYEAVNAALDNGTFQDEINDATEGSATCESALCVLSNVPKTTKEMATLLATLLTKEQLMKLAEFSDSCGEDLDSFIQAETFKVAPELY